MKNKITRTAEEFRRTEHTLMQWIRDKKNQKVGVLISLGNDNVGWSKSHSYLEKFNEDKAIAIAFGRAKSMMLDGLVASEALVLYVENDVDEDELRSICYECEDEDCDECNTTEVQLNNPLIPYSIQAQYKQMIERSKRYYK
jgi:hypothetical protein